MRPPPAYESWEPATAPFRSTGITWSEREGSDLAPACATAKPTRYATRPSHSWQRTSSSALSSILGSSISGTITTFEPSQVEQAISTSVECMPFTGSGSRVLRKILSFDIFRIASLVLFLTRHDSTYDAAVAPTFRGAKPAGRMS